MHLIAFIICGFWAAPARERKTGSFMLELWSKKNASAHCVLPVSLSFMVYCPAKKQIDKQIYSKQTKYIFIRR